MKAPNTFAKKYTTVVNKLNASSYLHTYGQIAIKNKLMRYLNGD